MLPQQEQNKILFITYPMNLFDREAGMTLSKPSRFISELTSDLAEGWLLDEEDNF